MASSIAFDANTEYLNLKRKSSDIGWNYSALINSKNLDKVKCHLCSHKFSGGVYRLQQHIAGNKGNVKPCSVAKKKKCKAAIEERNKKKENKENQKEVRDSIQKDDEEEDDRIAITGSKRQCELGSMDKYAFKIDPDSSINQ